MRLKDKVAIITGSGGGMGRAASILFAQEGCKVVVDDIKEEMGRDTVKMIKDSGGEAIFIGADIMAGATLVGTHFLVPMIKGVGAFGKLRKELVDWLEKHGYESLDQIKGMALQYIGTENFEPLPAVVDEALCNGCGDCEQVCYWIIRRPPSAISVDPSMNKAKVDENWCQGCGWCTVVCPQDALKLRGWA